MQNNTESWRKLLNFQRLTGELLTVALFNLVFELLRDSVVDQVKNFYLIDNDDDSHDLHRYKTSVLSRHKSEVQASLLWLEENGAIDAADLSHFDRIREHRNEVIHELPQRLGKSGETVNDEIFHATISLMSKVDCWFIREVEIPTNPDIDPDKVDFEAVMSGRMVIVRVMLEVLSGSTSFEDAIPTGTA